MTVANSILYIVQSQSAQAAMVTGYVLLARVVDLDGRMHTHVLKPRDQDPDQTGEILATGSRQLTQD